MGSFSLVIIGMTTWKPQETRLTFFALIASFKFIVGEHIIPTLEGVKSITNRSFKNLACSLALTAVVASKTMLAFLSSTAYILLADVLTPFPFANLSLSLSSLCPAIKTQSKYLDRCILTKRSHPILPLPIIAHFVFSCKGWFI